MSPDYLCRWQVQVSVYCARRIPAYHRCSQCATLLHHIDICFIPCICLWQIPQIQIVCVWLSDLHLSRHHPQFMKSSASHPAGPHGRLPPPKGKSGTIDGAGVSTQFAQKFVTAVTAPPLVGCVVYLSDLAIQKILRPPVTFSFIN